MAKTASTSSTSARPSSTRANRRRPKVRYVLIAVVTAMFAATAAVIASAAPPAPTHPPTAYQLSLRAKVDTGAGAPQSGRDPAVQQQTSLAAAARQPVGNGARVAKPAAKATKDHLKDVTPSQVITAPKLSHQLASGCATGYGTPGVQCLPAQGPGGAKLTCMYVMNIFPDGVGVLGPDRLKLDSNGDGVACGVGDAM